ncbi:VOC family protein [Sphingomonas sp.]|uniref:VOC family protein n=1 Tax=Sphingomonas sp. TaxID=28214 RepID=UPI002BC958FC|nr:VOC family protein [Sphingomonas sp.]HTG38081.1 VOC family protein [Sphingomonas sp.]
MRSVLRAAALLFLLPPTAGHAQSPSPRAARGDHVALAVADLDASARFYKRVFGFAELKAPVVNRRWLDLGGGFALHLIPDRTAPVGVDRGNHLAITVGDFDAFVADLVAMGIAFTDFEDRPSTVQRLRTDGVRQVYIRDPDGHRIEVNDAAPPRR